MVVSALNKRHCTAVICECRSFGLQIARIANMKSLLLYIILGFTASIASAQAPQYTAANPGWMVDLDEAYAASKKEHKPILANFTGSDWCGWCKKLTADVFSKPEFKTWASKNVILLELDFPRRTQIPDKYRRQNAQLQNAFQIRGYPTIWVFDIDKDATGKYQINGLGKTGYTPSVSQFTSTIDQMIN